MDINSQQQINTFVGGMNTDTSDAMLDSSQYRDALNLRIVTNTDSNSGELRMIEGTEEIYSFSGEIILKVASVRDYVAVITKNATNNKWSIYRCKKSDTIGQPRLLFGPCDTPIWETGKDPDLSVICNYESETKIKLYIADGIHEIMCLNLYDTPSPNAVPTNILYLRDYIDNMLPNLNVAVYTEKGGKIPAAKVLYYYRLYSSDGLVTKMSPSSKILSLYKDKNSGYENSTNSGRAVSIILLSPNQDSLGNINLKRLQYVQIYRINYILNGQVPTVSLIADLKYKDCKVWDNSAQLYVYMVIDDGAKSDSTLAISEFLSMLEQEIIPKQIEVKNNYMFASNLKYKLSEIDSKFRNLDLSQYIRISARDADNNTVTGPEYTISDQQQANDYALLTATYRPGETYRFGVIFYDEQGNKSSVFWLRDITIPDYSEYSWMVPNILYSSCEYTINPPAIRVELLNQIPNCSKYEIVRCERTISDKYTITQGLLGRPLELHKISYTNDSYDTTSEKLLAPSGYLSMGRFDVYGNVLSEGESGYGDYYLATSAEEVLQFASPEYVHQKDDCQLLFDLYSTNLKIKTIADYIPHLNDCLDISTETNRNNLLFTHIIYPESNYINNYSYKLAWNNPKYYDNFANELLQPGTYSIGGTVRNLPDNIVYIKESVGRLNDKYEVAFLYGDALNWWQYNLQTRNDLNYYISFNVLYPYTQLDYHVRPYDGAGPGAGIMLSKSAKDREYSITDISYTNVPEWNDFLSADEIRYDDDNVFIGDYIYNEWSNLFLSKYTDTEIKNKFSNITTSTWLDNGAIPLRYPVGTTGECVLFKTSTEIAQDYSYSRKNGSSDNYLNALYGPFVITIADIKKSAIPYGGSSEYAKRNSVYYSFGDVFNNDIAEAEHTITSGDCYIRMFKYNALHAWFDATYSLAHKMSTVYCVPLFTDIDLHGESGFTYDRNNQYAYYILDKAASFDKYVQPKDSYVYNTAYNEHPNIVGYSPVSQEDEVTYEYDTRVHYSEQKTNNEQIDSWMLFRTMNFLDVDSRFGLITDTKLFKDKLIFWQENAAGVLAVNERVILQDSNDTQVTLGTGSVLDRYDYISTVYGMKPGQHASCVSNDALYWWDGNNKEILQYVEKYSVTPLALVKNIRNYINSHTENNHPHIYYDRKYKEIVCQCVNNEAVAYNELLQRFTSRYNTSDGFLPTSSTYVEDVLLLASGSKLHQRILNKQTHATLFRTPALPKLKWVVNKENMLTKTYDMQIIGGSLYGGSTRIVDNDNPALFQNQPNVGGSDLGHIYHTIDPLRPISIEYNTSLKLTGEISGKDFTNREYDYRLNIPRENEHNVYGGRLRGKTMQCELSSNSNSTDFSLQYIITKYRMSWS